VRFDVAVPTHTRVLDSASVTFDSDRRTDTFTWPGHMIFGRKTAR